MLTEITWRRSCAIVVMVLFAVLSGQTVFDNGAAAQTTPAIIHDTKTAALPQIGPSQRDGLPKVLSASDERRYREIFTLQEAGRWSAADAVIARLGDDRLMGHVLFQRYMHPTAYRSSYRELSQWLKSYADHPGAKRVHKLAMQRRPSGDVTPPAPANGGSLNLEMDSEPVQDSQVSDNRSAAVREQARGLLAQIRSNVLNTRLTISEKRLAKADAQKILSRPELAQALGTVAHGWYFQGNLDKALALAEKATEKAWKHAPRAHWIGGLSSWRQGRLVRARGYFVALASSPAATDNQRAAGAYWAARAALKQERPQEMSRWLRAALKYPRTFYGLMAHYALGLQPRFDFARYAPASRILESLMARPRIARAVALAQAGQEERAREEFALLEGSLSGEEVEGVLYLADRAGVPSLAYRLADIMVGELGSDDMMGSLDVGLYPIPPWKPHGGFQVDRALLYAFMRQESNFQTHVSSGLGARGLMQIMPATARYLARKRESLKPITGQPLDKPDINLAYAQQYLLYLMEYPSVGEDLIRLMISYNAGPGNLQKWEEQLADSKGAVLEDPLLFLESLPSYETRQFVRRVLTNLWIYRKRLGQIPSSLEDMASGDWPRYASYD
ncbi:lytic transglycosylase domain-containing protein [Fodinicurvata fenggangensis]|uniref:lytic transglycosylase domain-containing protein n=1 Tax=Fodinicurvata fenggangensis TaxID=1121830 RepID=UPI00068D9B4E|nr:lytic transglycosylase domain-containing protein [Fodinicurvata fenggangensis]